MELFLAFATLVSLSKVFRAMLSDMAQKKEQFVRDLVADNAELARTIFNTTPENLPSLAKAVEALPDEFYFFITEYAFQAVVEDVKDGLIESDTLTDMDKLSEALSHNGQQFCSAYLEDDDCRSEIAKSFLARMEAVGSEPWFSLAIPIMQKLKDCFQTNN